jgi:hypothetical protein
MNHKLIIPYDIIDNIIKYLHVESSRKFLLCSSNIYYKYRYSKYFDGIFIKKICNHFSSLTKINLNEKLTNKLNAKANIYNILNNIFNHYKFHKHISLSDLLVYLSEYNTTWHEYLFKIIISHCYYSKKKSEQYLYNRIKDDDLIYLLIFKKNVKVVTNYIQIDAIMLSQVIKSKINLNDITNVLYFINYLLYKHFLRYTRYIEEILSDIICDIIRLSNINKYYNILVKIYEKQIKYKFILNYQKIINACMQQTHIEYLSLVYTKMMVQKKMLKLEDRDIYPIIISKDYFRNLLKNNNYVILDKIIELFLGDKINMYIYFNEIYNNFDKSANCNNLFHYLTDKNRTKLLEKLKK